MFEKIFKNDLDHQIDSFLNSLSYFEAINLRMTLIRANDPQISLKDANDKAVIEFSNPRKLKFDFEKAIKTGY